MANTMKRSGYIKAWLNDTLGDRRACGTLYCVQLGAINALVQETKYSHFLVALRGEKKRIFYTPNGANEFRYIENIKKAEFGPTSDDCKRMGEWDVVEERDEAILFSIGPRYYLYDSYPVPTSTVQQYLDGVSSQSFGVMAVSAGTGIDEVRQNNVKGMDTEAIFISNDSVFTKLTADVPALTVTDADLKNVRHHPLLGWGLNSIEMQLVSLYVNLDVYCDPQEYLGNDPESWIEERLSRIVDNDYNMPVNKAKMLNWLSKWSDYARMMAKRYKHRVPLGRQIVVAEHMRNYDGSVYYKGNAAINTGSQRYIDKEYQKIVQLKDWHVVRSCNFTSPGQQRDPGISGAYALHKPLDKKPVVGTGYRYAPNAMTANHSIPVGKVVYCAETPKTKRDPTCKIEYDGIEHVAFWKTDLRRIKG